MVNNGYTMKHLGQTMIIMLKQLFFKYYIIALFFNDRLIIMVWEMIMGHLDG